MFGIEASYCNAMIDALIQANRALLEMTLDDAVAASYVPHKGDTLGLDQVPENTIASVLNLYDQFSVLITEERGEDANPLAHQTQFSVRGPRTFFGCDPCDRSSPFRDFLISQRKSSKLVADALGKKSAIRQWEKEYSGPCSITGANAAITCVRRGLPIGAVLLNYITHEITIACSAGIFQTSIADNFDSSPTLDTIDRAQQLNFPNVPRKRNKHFVTFMGKPQRGYPQNFAMTKLAKEGDLRERLHYNLPGGPTRVLYLSDQQPSDDTIGFIVANGEKIGEWIHWLPFVRFAHRQDDRNERALHLFEITQDESPLRDRYLMTPTEPYSIFKESDEGRVTINVERLGEFDNPSKYRATLLIASATNHWAIGHAQQYGYRPLIFHGD